MKSISKILIGLLGLTFAFSSLAKVPNTGHWSVTWKTFNMTGPMMEQVGRVKTLNTKELPYGNWSVGCETLDRDYADFAKYKPWMGELGARSARIQSGWAKSEPKKGKYNFAWLDEIVDGLIEEGVTPWICLGYGNPIYGSEMSLGSKIFSDEPTINAWLKYIKTTVSRYKDRVYEWEIWNEPNLGDDINNANTYASLASKTIDVIKEVQPNAVIIVGALSRMPLNFTKEMLEYFQEADQLENIDYLSFHPYFENPDDATPGIYELRALVDTFRPEIKLFMGECGCPANLEWGHALRYHQWTEISQAKWVARRMIGDWSMGTRCSIFTMVDLKYTNMQQSFGLLRANLLNDVIYERPSYHTFRHIVNLFTPEVTPCRDIEFRANTYRDLKLTGVLKDGKKVGAVMWFGDKVPNDELTYEDIDLYIKGIELKEPVWVDLITGRIYSVKRFRGDIMSGHQKFTGLHVWDSPMLLIDREFLPEVTKVTKNIQGGSIKDMKY